MKRKLARHFAPMFWSTRTNSCRQFVCCAGEALNTQLPGPPLVGSGIIASIGTALGSTGTRLPGKKVPVAGSMGQSLMSPLVGFGQSSLKLPLFSANEGTGVLKTMPGTTSLRHSCDQKKNVLVLSWL